MGVGRGQSLRTGPAVLLRAGLREARSTEPVGGSAVACLKVVPRVGFRAGLGAQDQRAHSPPLITGRNTTVRASSAHKHAHLYCARRPGVMDSQEVGRTTAVLPTTDVLDPGQITERQYAEKEVNAGELRFADLCSRLSIVSASRPSWVYSIYVAIAGAHAARFTSPRTHPLCRIRLICALLLIPAGPRRSEEPQAPARDSLSSGSPEAPAGESVPPPTRNSTSASRSHRVWCCAVGRAHLPTRSSGCYSRTWTAGAGSSTSSRSY
jgi:hypothetical protein